LPTKGAVSGPVTESIFKVEDATPIDSFKILVRHYAIDQTIFYHPLIKCPTVGSSGSGFIERILSYLTLSIAYALTTNCSDEDTSSVERSNYDTISRDGYNSYIEYPYITSQHYYKSTSRCLWDDETIHDDEYSSAFPGNKTWTCPESRTATTGIPYTHTARRKGSGVSVWYIYYSNPVFPWNFIKQTEITDTIQEDSRADLIINGGDPDVEYLASIPVSAVPILPDSLRPGDKVSVNGWFYGDPIHCKKLSPAPGHAAVWSHNDPYSCYLKYLVRGNSITDVTPFFAGAPYYAYDVGGTPLTSVVPAGPAPSIISGTISYRGSMLANILSVMNSNLVTYTGTNIPTDGTATVLLYGNDNMYQIVPTVESESQFSFVVPDYLPVGMYSVRIMGGNTMPSEPITLNVLNRYIRPYDPLPPGTRGTGSATSTDTVPSDGRDYSAP
jgi:hypothetical protein